MSEHTTPVLFTIGHSNHTIEAFIGLLKSHCITAVADVRSQPYSRHTPQFNKDALSAALQESGIAYVFLGRELGARPEGQSSLENGHVSFQRLACSEGFARGIERLLAGAAKHRIAIMCAEKEPLFCHRTILIARHLRDMGTAIKHILPDGQIEDNHDSEKRLVHLLGLEPDLFEQELTRPEIIERAYDRQAENIAFPVEAIGDKP